MTREQEGFLETREHRVLVRLFAVLVFLIGLIVFWPLNSYAAGQASGAEPSIWDTRFYWINFLLYVGGMYFLLRGILSRGWDSRRERIRVAAERGKIAAEAAQAELRNVEERFKNLPTEITNLQAVIAKEAISESEQVERDSAIAITQISNHTKTTIVAERKALEREVRKELAATVMAKVEQRLARDMTAEIDTSLRQAAIGSARMLVQ